MRIPSRGMFCLLFVAGGCSSSAGPFESPNEEPHVRGAISSVSAEGGRDEGDPLAVRQVLLLSIDGLHQADLARFIAGHPTSALAKLSKHGIEYTNAWVNALDGTPTNPSDSFPGLLALTTGGSSPTTGGWYDVSYARDLYPDSTCGRPGTAVTYDESVELDNGSLWGSSAIGAGPTHDPLVVRSRLDPTKLPYRKTPSGCSPVYPHNYLRVNTIFEVAHAAGRHTAWSDKHLAYEIVTGPSGKGLDDFFAPEINSDATQLPATGSSAGQDFTTKAAYTKVYDDFKAQAILNQIDGKWSDDGLPGASDATGAAPGVPAIFGMNFQAVSVAQKDAKWGPGGYLDGTGVPSPELADALAHTDASIGRMVSELQAEGLFDSTLIIVTAKHGQSPIDKTVVAKRDGDAIAALVDAVAPVAGHIEDDVALYWLADSSQADLGARALHVAPADGSSADPSLGTVFTASSPKFAAMFGNPRLDPRTPDIVVQPKKGTIYSTSSKKWAEHGGFADDDAHVGLLVSNPALGRRVVDKKVRTKQVAPTILRALGLDPSSLEAVQKEGTAVLPGLRFDATDESPIRWTADEAPAPVTIAGGPWTLAQLAPGTPVPPPTGTTLTNRSYGYCVGGARASNPGSALMQPYYFPHVVGHGTTLQGFFDWRPKDINESLVAASSTDAGLTWTFQQEAMVLTTSCPIDITQTNPDAAQADDGFGHAYTLAIGDKTFLYLLDRSDASIDNLGLVVNRLDHSGRQLEHGMSNPLSPMASTVAGAGALTRTTGLLNPDGIVGVVPDSWPAQILYIQKQKGADNAGTTALPPSQRCSAQPYLQPGAGKPKAPNHDIVTVRRASTSDGINFTDLGAVYGLNDSTTTSYLGTRYIAPSGTVLGLGDGRYGLFFAAGNCLDADSDAFHYIGYAESTDLTIWTIVNGIDNPIASLATNVVTEASAPATIPAQQPVVGPALDWFESRVYAPAATILDRNHVTLVFAGYSVQSPNSDLLHYRQIGRVVLTASRPLRAHD